MLLELMVSQQEFRSELLIQERAIDAIRGFQEDLSVASGVCTANSKGPGHNSKGAGHN